jgi:hypothetical protein
LGKFNGYIAGLWTDVRHAPDRSLTYHSPDPTDPAVTVRVITVMLADEY